MVTSNGPVNDLFVTIVLGYPSKDIDEAIPSRHRSFDEKIHYD